MACPAPERVLRSEEFNWRAARRHYLLWANSGHRDILFNQLVGASERHLTKTKPRAVDPGFFIGTYSTN